ncbi:MAG: imidazolonepropionase [Rhizobiaceae bacterium]
MATPNLILTNATLATMQAGSAYGLIEDGTIAISGGRIAWAGKAVDVPADYSAFTPYDLEGRLVTPGLIDCHTHVVFGGNRAREFEMRLNGATYEDIARAGGGILSTVSATRASSEDQLLIEALARVDAMLGAGVTILEIKSGYGLTIDAELVMLRVARRIGKVRPVGVLTTFLAAHAIPPEYRGRADAYLDEVCLPALDEAHDSRLVDAVDGFCEGIAFSPAQIERLFAKAKSLGLPVKLHAEQLSDLGGAALAASHGALSCDHLEYLGADGVQAMAKSGSVAVMLPGAFYTLREKQLPPVEALRAAGVPMAVATDCNPGSSPMTSLLLAMNMACTLFRMTPEEALAGVTRNAAKALGLNDTGVIVTGNRADLAVWNASHPAELPYNIGFNPIYRRMYKGEWQ